MRGETWQIDLHRDTLILPLAIDTSIPLAAQDDHIVGAVVQSQWNTSLAGVVFMLLWNRFQPAGRKQPLRAARSIPSLGTTSGSPPPREVGRAGHESSSVDESALLPADDASLEHREVQQPSQFWRQTVARRRAGQTRKRFPGRFRRVLPLESLEPRQVLAATPLPACNDEFQDVATLSDWGRLQATEGWHADQLHTWDINQTHAGRMVLQPSTAVWYEDYRGPLVYREIAGDFVITTELSVSDRDDRGVSDPDVVPGDALFSLAGLMIRTPRPITHPATDWQPGSQHDDGTNQGENYVLLSLGYGQGANTFSLAVNTTRNSHAQWELTPLNPTASTIKLQLARIGSSVITLYQFPGEAWRVHRRYARPDLPHTVQVGMVASTDWAKASDYAPFVHNSRVLVAGQVTDPTPGESFNPDLTASFEYFRCVRPDVPAVLAGVELSDPSLIDHGELLRFLGAEADIVSEAGMMHAIQGVVFDDWDRDGIRDLAPTPTADFHFVIYADELVDDWTSNSYDGGTVAWNSNLHVYAGDHAAAITLNDSQSGVSIRWRGVFPRTLNDYDTVRMQVYGNTDLPFPLLIGFGGTGETTWWHRGPVVTVEPGRWQELVIPVDTIEGQPDAITGIHFLSQSDEAVSFFLDDLALVGTGNRADHSQIRQLLQHPNQGGPVDTFPPQANNWGVNLFVHADWGFDAAFIDVARSWRQWGLPDAPWIQPEWQRPLTEQGIPREDFGAFFLLRGYESGTYRLRYEGTADVAFHGGLATIIPGSHSQSQGVTTVDVSIVRRNRDTFPHDAEPAYWVSFRNVDPNDPVRNIRMLSPGYDFESSQLFRHEFLARLSPFSTIRFMQWTNTNYSFAEDWSRRRLPGEVIQTGGDDSHGGIAWEYVAALANEAGKDAWINIPHQANDQYVRELARLMRDQLDPSLRLYVEFSNELWNWDFPATRELGADYYHVVAPRLRSISEIFQQEFGHQRERVEIVLAVQAGWDLHAREALRWFDDQGLVAADFIDSLSIAPYFNVDTGETYSDLDVIANELKTMEEQAYMMRQHDRIAEAYGLKLNAYEGGPHFTPYQAADPTLAYRIQEHPEMGEAYVRYQDTWLRHGGGGLFMQYQFLGDHWGLLEDIRDPGSVKWDALLGLLLPPGDVTLDRLVNYDDFQVVRDAFGEGPLGNPADPQPMPTLRDPSNPALRWREQGDLNQDQSVNAADLQLLYAHLDLRLLTTAQQAEIESFAAHLGITLPDNIGSGGGNADGGTESGGGPARTEPGLAGVTLYLDVNRNRIRDPGEVTTTSDAHGQYAFTDLPVGSYPVAIVVPEGWQTTAPISGWQTARLDSADSALNTHFGLASAPVEPPVTSPMAAVRLDAFDLVGNPISSLVEGEQFDVRVRVEALQAASPGLFAAYLDLSFPSLLANVVSPPQLGINFVHSPSIDITTPGLLNEIGGHGGLTPPATTSPVLFTIRMQARSAGVITFLSDPADFLPNHSFLLFDSAKPVPVDRIEFGQLSLNIVAINEWHHADNPYDVNRDQYVTPQDALMIINSLLRDGIRPLVGPAGTDPRYDVDNDRELTPTDALRVINELNRRSANVSESGEGEADPASVPRAIPTRVIGSLANFTARSENVSCRFGGPSKNVDHSFFLPNHSRPHLAKNDTIRNEVFAIWPFPMPQSRPADRRQPPSPALPILSLATSTEWTTAVNQVFSAFPSN